MASKRVFIIGVDKSHYYGGLLISILFFVIGAVLFLFPDILANHRYQQDLAYIRYMIFFIFGAVIFVASISKLVSKEPELIINDRYLKKSGWPPIYWGDIESFSLFYKYKGGYISVNLINKQRYLSQLGFLKRIFVLPGIGFPSPIMISGFGLLDTNLKDLYELLLSELSIYTAENA